MSALARLRDHIFFRPAHPLCLVAARCLCCLQALWILLSRPDLPELAAWPAEFRLSGGPWLPLRFGMLGLPAGGERGLFFALHGLLLCLQGGHDDSPFLHTHLAHLAVTCQETIHTRKQFIQLAPSLFQTHRPVFGSAELLTDVRSQRRPARFGDQVGFGIRVAPAAGHPDIAGAEGAAEFPEGTEFIVVSVNVAVGSDHVWAPLHGDKIRRRLVRNGAPTGGIELLQQVHRLQQRFRTLIGVEGKGVKEGWGKPGSFSYRRGIA